MEEALRAFIQAEKAVTDITPAGQIGWGLRPQGAKLPAICLNTVGGTDDITHDGPSGLADTRVQIDCWARTIGEAKKLARVITTLLNGKRFETDGINFCGIHLLSRRDTWEGDGKGEVYRTMLDFRVWHSQGQPAETFNPASLFSGQQGGFYDPSDLASMGVSINAAVVQASDRSGNDRHLMQAIASRQPILRQDGGGFRYLEHDGVDDGMASASFGGVNGPFDRISAMVLPGWGGTKVLLDGDADQMLLFQRTASPKAAMFRGGFYGADVNLPLSVPLVVSERLDGANSFIRINGAQTNFTVGDSIVTRFRIGSRDGSYASTLRLYGLFVRAGTLSAAERTQVEAWMAGKVGA